MKKPRIYFLINSLEGGGAERVITTLSNELIKKFEIDIITLKPGVFYKLPEWIRHIPLSHITWNFFMIIAFPWFYLKCKNHFKKNTYSSGVSFLELSNFIHILLKKNAIISFRTSIWVFRWFFWSIYTWLIKILYPLAWKIIVNSEENRHELAKFLSIPIEKIVTLYNPIDLEAIEKFKNESLEKDIEEKLHEKRVFITVARLVWDGDIGSKNHSKILDIIKKLAGRGETNIIYLIVWDGPAMENLKIQVTDNELEAYTLFVWRQSNVFKFLSHADFVLYASEHEWFPNTLIEAMSVGVPIITSNFKTGSHEVIMWEYTWDHVYKYPLFGPNGVILDIGHFEEQFFEIYGKLDTIRQEKKWIERFTETTEKFIELLS